MLVELAVASAMVLFTVSIHALGLAALQRVTHRLLGVGRGGGWRLHAPAVVLVVLGLFTLHGLEIWSYAVLYHGLNAAPDLRTAVYFSTITYGAIGYSDAAIDAQWRLTAAIEGINGVLLIGWTTAFFVTTMAHLQRRAAR